MVCHVTYREIFKEDALFAVKNGIFTLNEAARRYSIPETTLQQAVVRHNVVQKKAPRSYIKRKDNPRLCRAVSLVLDQGMSIGEAVRIIKVAKTTLHLAIAQRKNKLARSARMLPRRGSTPSLILSTFTSPGTRYHLCLLEMSIFRQPEVMS